MSLLRRDLTVATGTSVDANLNPFQRFPGRGGRVSVQATCVVADLGRHSYTLLVGSDIVAQDVQLGVESIPGSGPITESQSSSGVGAPGDPITLTFTATAGAATNPITFAANIEFA